MVAAKCTEKVWLHHIFSLSIDVLPPCFGLGWDASDSATTGELPQSACIFKRRLLGYTDVVTHHCLVSLAALPNGSCLGRQLSEGSSRRIEEEPKTCVQADKVQVLLLGKAFLVVQVV